MDNNGFEFLKQAFQRVAGQYDPKDLGKKGRRILASGGKAAIETAKDEFPKASIEKAVDDVYGLLSSPEIANGISMTLQSMSFDDLNTAIDGLKDSWSKDEVIKPLAQMFRDMSKQGGLEALVSVLQDKVNDLPDMAQFMLQGVVNQIETYVSQFEHMELEEIEDALRDAIESIPSDYVAQMAFMAAQNVTPERITSTVQKFTGDLPSGKVLADTLHGVGDAAIKQLDLLANDNGSASLAAFVMEAKQIVTKAQANDNKQVFRKDNDGKGGFDFKL